jgi:hypothetical protein
MRNLPIVIRREIEQQDDEWVKVAHELASSLKEEKEGQLRNIQSVAEKSDSWQALSLFIRYQAARKQIPKPWAEEAVKKLEGLEQKARDLLSRSKEKIPPNQVHMELVSRVLGYAVRWHVWDTKKEA